MIPLLKVGKTIIRITLKKKLFFSLNFLSNSKEKKKSFEDIFLRKYSTHFII